jgi:hypothetical protein
MKWKLLLPALPRSSSPARTLDYELALEKSPDARVGGVREGAARDVAGWADVAR